ncbi:hypothetical protein KKA03_00555 [archaeon]|nr:hypothetical protein [archaeon]
MKRGAKAQLFTLDLLLALVPLTIAIGISASAMSGVAIQMSDYTSWYSNNRMINDAMDVLIKTPGDPPDWNSTNAPSILGLANYSTTAGVGPYQLDSRKVGALNASIAGGTIFSVGIKSLLGNETFSYMNLSFLGASANTTNLSINFATGSRGSVLNIYASERLALLALSEISGMMEEVGHFATNATACCSNAGTRVYNETFFVAAGETTTYDFWLVGEWQSGPAVTNKYGINPDTGVTCDCTGEPNYINLGQPNLIIKEQVDGILTENTVNELMVRPKGNGEANYYIIKAPAGTPENMISPNLAGAKPVKVVLEVGR